jgi:hypothetical protein
MTPPAFEDGVSEFAEGALTRTIVLDGWRPMAQRQHCHSREAVGPAAGVDQASSFR